MQDCFARRPRPHRSWPQWLPQCAAASSFADGLWRRLSTIARDDATPCLDHGLVPVLLESGRGPASSRARQCQQRRAAGPPCRTVHSISGWRLVSGEEPAGSGAGGGAGGRSGSSDTVLRAVYSNGETAGADGEAECSRDAVRSVGEQYQENCAGDTGPRQRRERQRPAERSTEQRRRAPGASGPRPNERPGRRPRRLRLLLHHHHRFPARQRLHLFLFLFLLHADEPAPLALSTLLIAVRSSSSSAPSCSSRRLRTRCLSARSRHPAQLPVTSCLASVARHASPATALPADPRALRAHQLRFATS